MTGREIRRVGVFSVHTSPLEAPGSGDAGGMNVYIKESAERLAALGLEVDIFTRATDPDMPEIIEAADGVRVMNVHAGPFAGLRKEDLPAQLVAVSVGAQEIANANKIHYDVLHSHYWLSGQVAWSLSKHWDVPQVHTMHTMAKVKNLAMAEGDSPEPLARVHGEEQIVHAACRLVANTHREAAELIEHYDADPRIVNVIHPGVNLDVFTPGDGRLAARSRLGWDVRDCIVLFVGRLQPLKAPDLLVRAIANMPKQTPNGRPIKLVICGGPSGNGMHMLEQMSSLVRDLGVSDRVEFVAPRPASELADLYRAADVVAVPSYSESFGLVAVEAQACGTPVIAAAVGGLVTAVKDGVSGVLVGNHEPHSWANALTCLMSDAERRRELELGALAHSHRFSWHQTAMELKQVYQDVAAVHRASDKYAPF